jgi:ABC-2 type transport system permease protein
MKIRRIWGVMLRYFYQFNHSFDRWLDAFYWPLFDIFLWGGVLTSFSFGNQSMQGQLVFVFSGLVLWYVVYRGQFEISFNMLEDFWSENLVNFFSSPIKNSEWITALFILGFIKVLITLAFMVLFIWIFYATQIFVLGFSLIPFIINLLIVSWSCGLVAGGLIFRYGTKMQSISWTAIFLLMPLSGVYFPLSLLPHWLQTIAYCLPSSYVFEGMRQILIDHTVPTGLMIKSFLLNCVFFGLAFYYFTRSLKKAKDIGIAHLK